MAGNYPDNISDRDWRRYYDSQEEREEYDESTDDRPRRRGAED